MNERKTSRYNLGLFHFLHYATNRVWAFYLTPTGTWRVRKTRNGPWANAEEAKS